MVILAAADETEAGDRQGMFLYGGFIAPVMEWTDYFTSAWTERVLNRHPPIPYMHMADIKRQKWQVAHGLSPLQAEDRIDEAVDLIAQMGNLRPILSEVQAGHFRSVFEGAEILKPGPQCCKHPVHPDFIMFIGFAISALEYVRDHFPDVEKVDFLVERKQGVSNHLQPFFDGLPDSLIARGDPELVPLVGELIPGGKDRVPLQAADVGIWHLRRVKYGEHNNNDLRRVRRMFNGRAMKWVHLKEHEVAASRQRANEKAFRNGGTAS